MATTPVTGTAPATGKAPAPTQAEAAAMSLTLLRGLEALELLADAKVPLTIAELSKGLGVHRSNAYRILRTLEHRRFVVRDDAGRIRLGPKLTALSRGVAPELHAAALPVVTDVAYSLGMTAFLTVLDADEVVTLATVEPSNVEVSIARDPGVRHSVDRGAPGHAIESSLSAPERLELLGSADFSTAAIEARKAGYAVSRNEVVNGVSGLAVPLRIVGEPPAALAIVHFSLPESLDEIVATLQTAATRITQNYR